MRENEKKAQALQGRLGTAPDDFRRHVLDTLDTLEEKKPMKRFTIRTAALALLILCLMVGAALAIGSSLGVLTFIERDGTLPEEGKQAIQTEFTQRGGDLENTTVQVLDAVSDGRSLFMTFQVKAKNPEDAVMASGDNIDWADTALLEAENPTRDQEATPNWQSIQEGQTVHYVSGFCGEDHISVTAQDGQQLWPRGGYNWRYEGTDTVVLYITLSLDRLENPYQPLTLKTVFCEQVEDMTYEKSSDVIYSPFFTAWNTTDETDIEVTITPVRMQEERLVMEAPTSIGGYHLDSLEVIVTPLAMYLKESSYWHFDEEPEHHYFIQWCNENGELLVETYQVGILDKEWENLREDDYTSIFARRDALPEKLILHAHKGYNEPEDAVLDIEDVEVPLVPVTE